MFPAHRFYTASNLWGKRRDGYGVKTPFRRCERPESKIGYKTGYVVKPGALMRLAMRRAELWFHDVKQFTGGELEMATSSRSRGDERPWGS